MIDSPEISERLVTSAFPIPSSETLLKTELLSTTGTSRSGKMGFENRKFPYLSLAFPLDHPALLV